MHLAQALKIGETHWLQTLQGVAAEYNYRKSGNLRCKNIFVVNGSYEN